MRRSKLPLKKLYEFTKRILENKNPNQKVKKKGRPKKYQEPLIIALWLFQILNKRSYRETLEEAKNQNFDVPSLSDYHYRVRQLDEELLQLILKESSKLLLENKQINCYIADATGFGFGDRYNLNWKRGTQIKTVQAHVRLEVVMAVDENGRKIITAVETGRPYESEIKMLRKALSRLEAQKGLPFIADKGYDSVDIIQTLLDKGFEAAISIKETMRMSIKHSLRKLSKGNWEKYGKVRYKIEQLFGNIKQKVGSSFNLLREDLARKVKEYLYKELLKDFPRKGIAEKSLNEYGFIFIVDNLEIACEVANYIAPEHLEIITKNPFDLLNRIHHAGAIFLGDYATEPLGDYILGPNHVLPTSRSARFSSPLGVYDFIKRSSVIYISKEGFSRVAKHAINMAKSEGLEAHKLSVEIRKNDL